MFDESKREEMVAKSLNSFEDYEELMDYMLEAVEAEIKGARDLCIKHLGLAPEDLEEIYTAATKESRNAIFETSTSVGVVHFFGKSDIFDEKDAYSRLRLLFHANEAAYKLTCAKNRFYHKAIKKAAR